MVDDIDYTVIQKRIRKLRTSKHLTQEEIADAMDTSQNMYSRYEMGSTRIGIRQIVFLSKYYGVSTDYILGLED